MACGSVMHHHQVLARLRPEAALVAAAVERCNNEVPGLGLVVVDAFKRQASDEATIRSAASSSGGSALPRRSARARMPRHALGLSVNRSGTLSCKISDNEDTTATLGDSKPACVQHSPSDVHRPEVCQLIEDCCEVPAARA